MEARNRPAGRAETLQVPGSPDEDAAAEVRAEQSVIAIVVGLKVVLVFFGFAAFEMATNARLSVPDGLLPLWNQWDAPHYLFLAQYGYQGRGPNEQFLAFFPLYPWLVRLFQIAFRDYFVSALVVSTIATFAAAVLMYDLARLDESRQAALDSVWFLFIFPTSFFLHIGYTESLFLALALGSFVAARHDNWAIAGLLGALAALTRLGGIVLIPALALEAFSLYQATRRWRWEWLWLGVIGLGTLTYLGLNLRIAGSPFAFLRLQHMYWGRSLGAPWTAMRATWGAVRSARGDWSMVNVQELIFTIIGLVGIFAAVRWLRPSYAMFMLGNWLLFACSSFLYSAPRLTLSLFPLFFLFARAGQTNRVWYQLISFWSALFLALFVSRYVHGIWAF